MGQSYHRLTLQKADQGLGVVGKVVVAAVDRRDVAGGLQPTGGIVAHPIVAVQITDKGFAHQPNAYAVGDHIVQVAQQAAFQTDIGDKAAGGAEAR